MLQRIKDNKLTTRDFAIVTAVVFGLSIIAVAVLTVVFHIKLK